MKLTKTICAALIIYVVSALIVDAQPIPVELMAGNKYGTVNLAFGKNFSPTSKFGFFHMNTIQFDYKDKNNNSFIIQDLAYFEVIKNLRIAGGVAYSKAGLDPTAGLQYAYNSKKMLILFAPRVNIESDPSYDVMTIIQYKPDISDKVKLYTRLQFLNLFNSDGNIKAYQWFRLGLEMKGIQFGLAYDIDEYGPNPTATGNFGVFVRKEIF